MQYGNEDILRLLCTLQAFSEKNSAISCEEILDDVYDVGELGFKFDVDELEEIKANFSEEDERHCNIYLSVWDFIPPF